MAEQRLRLGIDVGGTFTDVVALDAVTRSVVARVKVPTTHDAPEGVARGIISGIQAILTHGMRAEDVGFIAHSTTQATNALLEGDVASVAVVGLLEGLAPLARMQMRFAPIPLAPGVRFAPHFTFARAADAAQRAAHIDRHRAAGAGAIAFSQAFGVDYPDNERGALAQARARDVFATAGHEVSSMYGLRARTRTAALNAAILPRMVSTAEMTRQAVAQAAIGVPLMIMRSDGGVMDVREMERRPILTMLSGPAAGIAGALLHENVTDGIFVEVGGTSADCSAIRDGMPQMRPARIGGHRTMLRTVDVRTLAIAGGSMVRADASRILDIGPRSAHIAGLKYASFVPAQLFDGATAQRIAPTAHDCEDYVAIIAPDGTRIALTTTCAANMLGLVGEQAFAHGDARAARRGFEILAEQLQADPVTLAQNALDKAAEKLSAAIDELISDYELDRRTLTVIGGGGGAAALVPHTARTMNLDFRLARDAEVISPVGVALALVREVVERTVVDPSPQDILRIRQQAQDAVVASGASPEHVQVDVEIDTRRNLVRATASGAGEMAQASAREQLTDQALRITAARLLRAPEEGVALVASTPALSAYRYADLIRVLDRHGVGRLALRGAFVCHVRAGGAQERLRALIEEHTTFGDVGRALPDVYVAHGARIADFRGLAGAEQALALAQEELQGREPEDSVMLFVVPKPA